MTRYLLVFFLFLSIQSFGQRNGARTGVLDLSTQNVKKPTRAQKAAIKIFPNPASDYIKVDHQNVVEKLRVYNILGVELKALKVEESDSLTITDLPKGMYFVQLLDYEGDIIKTVRFFKRNYRP